MRRLRPALLATIVLVAATAAHAQDFVNVYEIPSSVSMNVIGNQLTHEILNRSIHHWDQDTANKKAAAASAVTGAVALPTGAGGAAALLAKDLPADQARAGEAAYRQAYDAHEQVIRKFGLPSGDLGVGLASCIAGAWMAYNNKPFPDQYYVPLVKQMRQRLAGNADVARMPAAEKRTAYESLAITGMILASSQISWQRSPSGAAADALKARMRTQGGDTLTRMLNVAPDRVMIGDMGTFNVGQAAPEPAATVAPSVAATATAQASPPAKAGGNALGTVWHAFSDLGNPRGTYALDARSGANAWVGKDEEIVPSADGNVLLQRDYTSNGSADNVTHVTARSRHGKLLVDHRMEGWLGPMKPSPRDANVVLAPWAESVTTPERRAMVYDLSRGKVLYATAEGRWHDVLSWLPDGSLLRVQRSGQISQVRPGAGEQPLGNVRWPESRVPEAVYVSPDGTQALVQLAALRDTGSISGSDLWMMARDGSRLRRFTKNDLVAHAFWSPDGRRVAFTKDTGVACTATNCFGSCTVWVADATASDVLAVSASHDASQFRLKRPDGSERALGCPMLAWVA